MSEQGNKLGISSQFLHCPLLIAFDSYEGCQHECRYCFTRLQYKRQNKGKPRSEPIRPARLTYWERVLNGESIRNPMIEYLVKKKHPVQLGTKADPFPRGVEREVQNTRKFVDLCNQFNYPVYITTKNPDASDMPIDLLAKGNYVLGVSLASHKAEHIKMLERNTGKPSERIEQIPTGVFKKIIIKWHPFIPQLFRTNGKKGENINWGEIDRYLDEIAGIADAVAISFLNTAKVWDPQLLGEIGPDDFTELEELAILTYIKEQAHKRQLEFYTANYRALSDSPICCGLRVDEFKMYTPWVWGFLIWKLYTGEKEYLTENDLIDAFPDELRDEMFARIDVPLFSRWARYTAKKTTILKEYIKNFTTNRKMNPANFFAGVYSQIVDGEFRIYFKDYRKLANI
jgi:DNA repair photolyase